jgi:hypothetical protein
MKKFKMYVSLVVVAMLVPFGSNSLFAASKIITITG